MNAFSGGTEVTSFFRNTVKTVQKVGFTFDIKEFYHQNPTYKTSFEGTNTFILGFSKRYNHPINTAPFIAITTCNNADTNCAFTPTVSHRFHLSFVDPKVSDGMSLQDDIYLKNKSTNSYRGILCFF